MNIVLLRAGAFAAATIGALAVPGVARADDPAPFAALTERTEPVTYQVPEWAAPLPAGGEIVLGVANVGATAVPGVVVEIRNMNHGAYVPITSPNCWYSTDSGGTSAWCQLDQELVPGKPYAIDPLRAFIRPDTGEQSTAIRATWYTLEWAAQRGGIEELATGKGHGDWRTPMQGRGGPDMRLVPADLPIPAEPATQASVTVVAAQPSPSPSASASSSSAPSSPDPAPATTAPVGGRGGGLPVTGSPAVAVAGLGAALLLTGVLGYLAARRRRTHFTA